MLRTHPAPQLDLTWLDCGHYLPEEAAENYRRTISGAGVGVSKAMLPRVAWEDGAHKVRRRPPLSI